MKTLPKVFLTFLATVSVFYFVKNILGVFIRLALPENGCGWVVPVISLVAVVAVAVLMWKVSSNSSKGAVVETLKWAGIVGGIGFVGGFFGPMLLSPGSNQGPMLGLFLTGPDVARSVMTQSPHSRIFFVIYLLIATFMVLN